MFGPLKNIVDLIRSGIADWRKFKTDKEREETILGVLKLYFLMKDCVDEGHMLIADAGPDPFAKINAMHELKANSTLARWDEALRRQGIRLCILQDYIFGQDHLAVLHPGLQNKIREVVGNKMDRSLYASRHRLNPILSQRFPGGGHAKSQRCGHHGGG